MKKLNLLLCFVFLSIFNTNITKSQVLEQDSLALVALYNSTDGDNWFNNTNWLTGPVSTWHNIYISGNRVIKIGLPGHNLCGTIPPELGNLDSLEFILLSDNKLIGTIPHELGNLFNLKKLYLEGNQLTGNIPAELGNLLNLQELYLSHNQLTGTIPPEIGNLHNIKYISFINNQLTGQIPAELTNLSNAGIIYYISLGINNLSGTIPAEFGNMSNLFSLGISQNQLSGSIPIELGNMNNLKDLSLQNNQLTGEIPAELGNLYNLVYLYLNNNLLSGAIPQEIGNLPNLRYLYIHNNAFTDLPDLSSLSPMCEIKTKNNKFTFEDIEPNIFIEVDSFYCGTYDTVFTYAPQDSVLDSYDTIIDEGDSISLSALIGGANNVYQWYKNGSTVGGAVLNPYFTISSANISDEGIYTCEITNTLVTGLTLHRRPINLIVNPVGTNNRETTREIKIYPNPNNGTFYLTNLKVNNKIEICTIHECILYSKQIVQDSDKTIYFNGYSKGIYFIKISTNNFTIVEKIIVY